MSLEEHKITDNADTQGSHLGFASLPNTLAGSAEENKALFDEKVKEGLKPFINGLIDDLISPAAAAELGFTPPEGMDAETVQKAAEQLLEMTQDLDTDKADKVPEAKEDNLAAFDPDGNLKDSGFNPKFIQDTVTAAAKQAEDALAKAVEAVTTAGEALEEAKEKEIFIAEYNASINDEEEKVQEEWMRLIQEFGVSDDGTLLAEKNIFCRYPIDDEEADGTVQREYHMLPLSKITPNYISFRGMTSDSTMRIVYFYNTSVSDSTKWGWSTKTQSMVTTTTLNTKLSSKVDKLPGAKEDNLASFDANGNLRDSGFNPESIQDEIEAAIEQAKDTLTKTEVFIAKYDVTSWKNVTDAWTAGKAIFCRKGKYLMPLFSKDENLALFRTLSKESVRTCRLTYKGAWAYEAVKHPAEHTHAIADVTGLEAELTALKDAQGGQGSPGADGKDGEDGATFTPTVSSDGYISWTNDKGLANPAAVNIKGPKGDKGDDGVMVETSGYVNFSVTEDGILQCTYTGDEAPDYAINEDGHLILTL